MIKQSSLSIFIFYGVAFSAIRMLVGGFASLYLIQQGLTIGDISALKIVQAGVIIAIQIPLGIWIDSQPNRYPYFIFSLLVSALWLLLTAIGGSFTIFLVAEIFNAIGLALFSTVCTAIIVESYTQETGKKTYNKVLGHFFKIQQGATALCVVAGSFVSTLASPLIWYVATFILMGLATTTIFRRDSPLFRHKIVPQKTLAIRHKTQQILQYIQQGRLWPILIAMTFTQVLFLVLAQYWQIMLYDMFGLQLHYALFFGLFFAGILVLQSISAAVAQKWASLYGVAICLVCWGPIFSFL